jgi:protein CpxP
MNRLLLSVSLALALSGTLALAQEQDAAPVPAPTAEHYHAHNPQREVAKLSKKLNLSAEQAAKLEPIITDRNNKIAALKNDNNISPEVMKQQMRAIHQQNQATARHHPHARSDEANSTICATCATTIVAAATSNSRQPLRLRPEASTTLPSSPRATRGRPLLFACTRAATHFHGKSPLN